MSYTVYTAQYQGSPNHVAIFVETESNGSGLIFNVIGNILAGMTYEKRTAHDPIDSASFVLESKVRIGSIDKSDLPRFESACQTVAVPDAQLKLNGAPIDPSRPIRRCGEWVEDVKEKVIANGILKN